MIIESHKSRLKEIIEQNKVNKKLNNDDISTSFFKTWSSKTL